MRVSSVALGFLAEIARFDVELAKPLLRPLTGIDFGRVTYEPDFRATLAAADFRLVELGTLRPGSRRSAALAIAEQTAP